MRAELDLRILAAEWQHLARRARQCRGTWRNSETPRKDRQALLFTELAAWRNRHVVALLQFAFSRAMSDDTDAQNSSPSAQTRSLNSLSSSNACPNSSMTRGCSSKRGWQLRQSRAKASQSCSLGNPFACARAM